MGSHHAPGPDPMAGPAGSLESLGSAPLRRPGPPPRPRVTSDLRPPGLPVAPRWPPALRVSALLWAASFAAGLIALAATAANSQPLRARLTAAARAQDPGATADLVRTGVDTVLAGVVGVSALLLVVCAGCLVLVLRRRTGARWALFAAGLLTLLAVAVDQSVVSGGREVDRSAFLTQGGLVVLALAALLTRSARAWLRRPHG